MPAQTIAHTVGALVSLLLSLRPHLNEWVLHGEELGLVEEHRRDDLVRRADNAALIRGGVLDDGNAGGRVHGSAGPRRQEEVGALHDELGARLAVGLEVPICLLLIVGVAVVTWSHG